MSTSCSRRDRDCACLKQQREGGFLWLKRCLHFGSCCPPKTSDFTPSSRECGILTSSVPRTGPVPMARYPPHNLPKNRHRSTVMETYESPSTLLVHLGFFVMPVLVPIWEGTKWPLLHKSGPTQNPHRIFYLHSFSVWLY